MILNNRSAPRIEHILPDDQERQEKELQEIEEHYSNTEKLQ